MKRQLRDAGFSLAALVFFLTAASLVITLSVSVPSYVMQAQREREKEMIFRGEEYARAIQKYQRTLNLLPSTLDDLLTNNNGTRFLRKAYTDPVSGEPWRVIILNSDGTLTGSNVYQSMSQVPTTTSQVNTAAPQTASQGTKAPGFLTTSSITGSGATGLSGAGGAGAITGGGTGLGSAGTGGGLTGGANGTRAGTTGAVAPTSAQPTQQAAQNTQAVPLQGMVGVGSGSRGTGVMIYNKQEQYSNWEFLAQLQQRTNTQNSGGTGGGGTAAGGTGGTGGGRGTGTTAGGSTGGTTTGGGATTRGGTKSP